MRIGTPPPASALLGALQALAIDLMVCLTFYSRLPVPRGVLGSEDPGMAAFARASRMAPLAGAVLGALGALGLLLFSRVLGLPPPVAATLALGVAILSGGALHEDGLADVADGFGGGRDRDRKLEIMRDSRLGTFGALALLLSVLLRVASLSALLERHGVEAAAAALIGAEAASRGFGLLPLVLLPPARSDGLARSVGALPRSALVTALTLAVLLGASIPTLAGIAGLRSLLACAAAALASVATTALARAQLGGHTGDVSGAAQQISEIAFLLGLLVWPSLG